MKKFLESLSWGLPVVLAPFTLLLLFSQSTVPGDLLYPYKRGKEGIILAGASLNPKTKAFFHADLADRRFDEAEKLLLANADTAALATFLTEVETTQGVVSDLSDEAKKDELSNALIAKIDDYQSKLTKVQEQVGQNPSQQTEPSIGQQQSQLGTAKTIPQPTITATPTLEPVLPTTTAAPGRPTSTPMPTSTPRPTNTPQPTATSIPVPANQLPTQTTVIIVIDNTKDELEKIKERLKKEREERRTAEKAAAENKQKIQEQEKKENNNKTDDKNIDSKRE